MDERTGIDASLDRFEHINAQYDRWKWFMKGEFSTADPFSTRVVIVQCRERQQTPL